MKRPNILLILADQHRQDCLGCYGNPDIKTPHIDALASDGVRYDEHYTVYPVCTPSRYSMLSGLYAHQHTAWSNESTLPNGIATFPKLLRDAGYQTAAVGKMHFTPTYQDVGFDRMILSEQNGQGRFEDEYHSYLKDCGLIDSLDLTDQVEEYRNKAEKEYYEHFGALESDLDCEHHSTSWITRQALSQIKGWDSEGGNLLMAGYIKPHHPFDPPAPYSTMYDPEKLTLLDGYTAEVPETDYQNHSGFFDHKSLSEKRLREIMAMYYGAITQIDDHVGEMVSLLKEKGVYEDTMIIYTSDHGEYMGYHHMLLKGNFLYDPLAKIPLIIKYPQAAQKAGVSSVLSENIDLSATILECCQVPQADGMCGVSLLSGEKEREFVFAEGQYGTDKHPKHGYMIRSRTAKLLVNGSLDQMMFFDLEKDPTEQINLAGCFSRQAEIERHKQALIEKMLFSGVSKTHVDHTAPQKREQSVLNQKAKDIKLFVSQKMKENKP